MDEEVESPTREYVIEIIFLLAGVGFIVGSLFFWPGIMDIMGTAWLPDKDSYTHLGCKFFVACSVAYVIMFVYIAVQMGNLRRESSRVLPLPRRSNDKTWFKLEQFKAQRKRFQILSGEAALRKCFRDNGEDPNVATISSYTWEQNQKVDLKNHLISRCDEMSNPHITTVVWQNSLRIKDAQGTEFTLSAFPQDLREDQFPVLWRSVLNVSANMMSRLGWDQEVENARVESFNMMLDISKGKFVRITDIDKDTKTVVCDIWKRDVDESKLEQLEVLLEKLNSTSEDAAEVNIDTQQLDEIASLKLFALCKRAKQSGAKDEEIEQACGAESQKQKLIELIVSKENARDGSRQSSVISFPGVPVSCLVDPAQNVTRRQIFEAVLYVVGSIVFAAGTILWDPRPQVYGFHHGEFGKGSGLYLARFQWLAIADALFMLGSFIFAFAAFINATYIYAQYPKELPITEDLQPPMGSLRTISLAISSCSVFGGFSFIAGTMGFIPRQYMDDCTQGSTEGMEKIGCLFYIVGSILYTLSGGLSLFRLNAKTRLEAEHADKMKISKAVLLRMALKRRLLKEAILEMKKECDDEDTGFWRLFWGSSSQAPQFSQRRSWSDLLAGRSKSAKARGQQGNSLREPLEPDAET